MALEHECFETTMFRLIDSIFHSRPEKEVKVEKRRSMSSAGVMEGWLSGGKKRKKEGEQ